MATAPTQTASADGQPVPQEWVPPTGDQEFTFESVDKSPSWIDKNWASFDHGPALALPAGDVYGAPPYTTKFAHVGDKVIFKAAKGAQPASFEVVKGDPIEVGGTKRPPQQSGASLEDLLKQGYITPEDMNEDAKAQVAGRTPSLKGLIEGTTPPPEAQAIGEQLKVE